MRTCLQSFLLNNIDASGTGSGNFFVDLNLGNVTGSQTQLGISVPLPSKRARAAAAAAAASQQTTFCLVDDCRSDPSNCRDYHRRHKVCEVHSKTPDVTFLGKKQRFCQQCSRFHGLDEFDEGKRSCRKRLDGHNRRRRKSQPETILQQGNYLPNLSVDYLRGALYEDVYPSIAFEDIRAQMYYRGKMFSCVHSYSVQEAISTSFIKLLKKEDLVVNTYCDRIHALSREFLRIL